MVKYNIRKISFPITSERIHEVLNEYSGADEEGVLTEVVRKRLEPKGYFQLKTDEYIRYSMGWDLLEKPQDNPKSRKLTPLGRCFLELYNNGLTTSANEVLYFSFVTSGHFQNLFLLNKVLYDKITSQPEFEFDKTIATDLVSVETSQTIKPTLITSTAKSMYDLGFLKKKKRMYVAGFYNPTIQGVLITLNVFIRRKYNHPSARASFSDILENKKFQRILFTTKGSINHAINEGHISRILHIEERANLHQFYFFEEDLIQLTQSLIGGR